MSYYSGEQRRAAPRIDVRLPLIVTDAEGNKHTGTSNDLSNRGLGAVLDTPIVEREDYRITLTLPAHDSLPETPMEFHAFIIYCTPDPKKRRQLRTGGYFSQVSEHDRQRLDAFLESAAKPT